MRYGYEIVPRPPDLGGGWKLRLLQDDEEVGGGVFPVDNSDDEAGMAWFNECTEQERMHWLLMAASSRPADARHAYLLAEAHTDAESVAYDWLDSRMAE